MLTVNPMPLFKQALLCYSFDEHIKYDLPAMLNYALEVSGQEQLSYVGHSQGTAMGFGGFSSMPELAAKVKLFVPLAPVANISHCEGLFKALSYIYKEGDVSSYYLRLSGYIFDRHYLMYLESRTFCLAMNSCTY